MHHNNVANFIAAAQLNGWKHYVVQDLASDPVLSGIQNKCKAILKGS